MYNFVFMDTYLFLFRSLIFIVISTPYAHVQVTHSTHLQTRLSIPTLMPQARICPVTHGTLQSLQHLQRDLLEDHCAPSYIVCAFTLLSTDRDIDVSNFMCGPSERSTSLLSQHHPPKASA